MTKMRTMPTGGETRLQYVDGRWTFTVILDDGEAAEFGKPRLLNPAASWWKVNSDLDAACRAVAWSQGRENE